jgi:hypothetical protein
MIEIRTTLLSGNLFRLNADIHININDVIVFTVPEGYVSDMAGIPWFLHWWLRPTDRRVARAAIAHDYMYHVHLLQRSIADSVFQVLLREDGTSRRKAKLMTWAVHLFGKLAYMRGPAKLRARTPELEHLIKETSRIEHLK